MPFAFRRYIKNILKNYTEAQVKVREATSNDPWGPAGALLSEISDLTYNIVALPQMMSILWKRLGDYGANWRHVHKSLIVFDYIVKTGSEKVLQQCKLSVATFKLLQRFEYIDKQGQDQGVHVREKATQFIKLLQNDDKLKEERQKALKAKEIFGQPKSDFTSSGMKRHSAFVSSKSEEKRKEKAPVQPSSAVMFPDRARLNSESVHRDSKIEEPMQSKSQSPTAVVDLSSAAKSLQEISRDSSHSNVLRSSRTASEQSKGNNESFLPIDPLDDRWLMTTTSTPDDWSQATNQEIWGASRATDMFKPQFVQTVTDTLHGSQGNRTFSSSYFPETAFVSSSPISQANTSIDGVVIEQADGIVFDWPNAHPAVDFGSGGSGGFDLVSPSGDVRTKRQSPESFLGAGSTLVDLDSLFRPQWSRPADLNSKNPFMPSYQSNPSQTSSNRLSSPVLSSSPTSLRSTYVSPFSTNPNFSIQTVPSMFPSSPTSLSSSMPPPLLPPSYSTVSPPVPPTPNTHLFGTPVSPQNVFPQRIKSNTNPFL